MYCTYVSTVFLFKQINIIEILENKYLVLLYMFKFKKIFEDAAEKAAIEIIEEEIKELESEKVIPTALIPIVDTIIPIIESEVGITPSEK